VDQAAAGTARIAKIASFILTVLINLNLGNSTMACVQSVESLICTSLALASARPTSSSKTAARHVRKSLAARVKNPKPGDTHGSWHD
jgi:hypothetical protein